LLRKLEANDRVIVYFMGKEYEYIITDKVITGANDTFWLEDQGQGEVLVLQTCDPPGTTWNRLLLVAKPI
jgi:LPXTG-site transpeptidase (sortase) family protein